MAAKDSNKSTLVSVVHIVLTNLEDFPLRRRKRSAQRTCNGARGQTHVSKLKAFVMFGKNKIIFSTKRSTTTVFGSLEVALNSLQTLRLGFGCAESPAFQENTAFIDLETSDLACFASLHKVELLLPGWIISKMEKITEKETSTSSGLPATLDRIRETCQPGKVPSASVFL